MLSLGAWIGVGTFFALCSVALMVWELTLATPTEPDDGGPLVPLRPTPPPIAEAVGALARPSDPADRLTLERRLAQAGWQAVSAPAWFYAVRVVLALSAPLLAWSQLHAPPLWRGLAALGASALGYYLPLWVVSARRHARQRRLRRAVADLLDMLVSCLESGLGIDAALKYVAEEIEIASPELAQELAFANAEIAAGIPRQEALDRLDHRTGIEEISALTTVLGQAERYGAGVAPSIRAHAHLARRRRALRAEQRAAQASPILTVVMILFILPALFVVLLGPTLLQISEQFGRGGV